MYLHLHVALRRRKTVEAWESSNKAMLFVFFLLGDSPGSEFHVPTFIKFRRGGITQNKEYNIQNKAKVLNQDSNALPEIGELWVEKYCHVYRI
jgi:hypothetical protein